MGSHQSGPQAVSRSLLHVQEPRSDGPKPLRFVSQKTQEASLTPSRPLDFGYDYPPPGAILECVVCNKKYPRPNIDPSRPRSVHVAAMIYCSIACAWSSEPRSRESMERELALLKTLSGKKESI